MARRIAFLVSASLAFTTLIAASLALAQGAPPSSPPTPPPAAPRAPPTSPTPPPPPNNPPVVGTKAVQTDEDKELSGAFEASDVDGQQLTFTIASPPSKVKLTLLD